MTTEELVIQVLVAMGTIAVAILAIWGEWIKVRLGMGPKLVLTLLNPEGERIDARIDSQIIPTRYYHLKVSNKHRYAPATNTRIVIVGLERPAADNTWVHQSLTGPIQLRWRFDSVHALYSIVGPDDICDLGYISRDGKFELTTYIAPNNLVKTVRANEKMRVEVKAFADNAESKSLFISISWDGIWVDDTLEMAKNHLVVKEVRPRSTDGT